MSLERRYVIRDWGEGFWRWSCLGERRTSGHSGIVGPPFKRQDAQRAAEAHWDEAHDAAPRLAGAPPHAVHVTDLRLGDFEDAAQAG